jgi:hypothetical protein
VLLKHHQFWKLISNSIYLLSDITLGGHFHKRGLWSSQGTKELLTTTSQQIFVASLRTMTSLM